MKIGVLHARYLIRGGEDLAVDDMVRILRDGGHDVSVLEVTASTPKPHQVMFDRGVYAQIQEWLRDDFEIIHAHNTFPRSTTPLSWALRDDPRPFVQHLHNYRASCLSANHFRDGTRCFDCTRARSAWSGVRHGCYRGSTPQSLGALLHAATAEVLRRRPPDVYVVPSQRMRALVAPSLPHGVPITVVPNGLAVDPPIGSGGHGAIFVGRLVPEKGVLLALEAAESAGIPITVVGDGPLRDTVSARAQTWIRTTPHERVLGLMGCADVTLAPSTWEEPFGRVVIESLGTGTPVLSLGWGATAELWPQGVCESVAAMSARMRTLAASDREQARSHYQTTFTSEAVLRTTMDLYRRLR